MNPASKQYLLLNMPGLKFVCLVCKHSSHSSTSSQIYLAISFVRILQRRLSSNLHFSDGQASNDFHLILDVQNSPFSS